MAKLKLPHSLLDLNEKDRDEIVAVLLEASNLPKTKELPARRGTDEHNMWERNVEPLMADAEDELYSELASYGLDRTLNLMSALGLPLPEGITKSFEPEFLAFEDELIKAKDSGRNRMSDKIKQMAEVSKKKVKQFIDWLSDGKPLSRQQVSDIDTILSRPVVDYAKKAERYMTRAGFIGKIRGEAEKQGFEVVGAIVDRYPQSIEAGRKEGVTLTIKHWQHEQKNGNTTKILPLTPREADAVTHASHHAGDKITEISNRHMAGIRQLVIQAKKERWTAQQLASKLFDKFGEQNRDWRRVAITELAFATTDAYISGIEEGETVVGMGAENACKHCKQYVIGKTFEVTHNPPTKDTFKGDMKQVWVGKTNYGRKVAEYRPCIPQHPACRCRWHRISRFYKVGNDGKLELKSTAELINEERAKRGLEPDKELQAMDALSDEDRLRKMTEQFLANQ